MSQLPHLEKYAPKNPNRVAQENAEKVAEMKRELLGRILSIPDSNAVTSLEKAVETIRQLFREKPNLKIEKTKAVLDHCDIARQIALKALRKLRESSEYHGHVRRRTQGS